MASSSTKRDRSPDPKHDDKDEDEWRLNSNDEAFHLSIMRIMEIIDVIQSRKTPTAETLVQWDEYALSFYLKMCTCFGVDYKTLKDTTFEDGKKQKPLSASPEMPSKEKEEHMECSDVNLPSKKDMPPEEHMRQEEQAECSDVNPTSTKEMSLESIVQEEQVECSDVNLLSTEEMSLESIEQEEELDSTIIQYLKEEDECTWSRKKLKGPFNLGSYSPETTPNHIPYHLYLLVKEAADIMKGGDGTNDLIDLQWVEQKILFFVNYFHCHLPTGWNYHRDNASSLIANYDTTRKPRYLMTGYTPIEDPIEELDYDEESGISPQEMVDVMSIIHSRKKFPFWEMTPEDIAFYCKICSCFRIDYCHLEDASEDDVSLMYTGKVASF